MHESEWRRVSRGCCNQMGIFGKKLRARGDAAPGKSRYGQTGSGLLITGPDAISMRQKPGNGERARSLLCGREALAKPAGAAVPVNYLIFSLSLPRVSPFVLFRWRDFCSGLSGIDRCMTDSHRRPHPARLPQPGKAVHDNLSRIFEL